MQTVQQLNITINNYNITISTINKTGQQHHQSTSKTFQRVQLICTKYQRVTQHGFYMTNYRRNSNSSHWYLTLQLHSCHSLGESQCRTGRRRASAHSAGQRFSSSLPDRRAGGVSMYEVQQVSAWKCVEDILSLHSHAYCTCRHECTHKRADTRANTQHTCSHTHTQHTTHTTHMLTHTHEYTHTRTHTLIHARTHARKHTHTDIHTCTVQHSTAQQFNSCAVHLQCRAPTHPTPVDHVHSKVPPDTEDRGGLEELE